MAAPFHVYAFQGIDGHCYWVTECRICGTREVHGPWEDIFTFYIPNHIKWWHRKMFIERGKMKSVIEL